MFQKNHRFGYVDIYLYNLQICKVSRKFFGLYKNDKFVALKKNKNNLFFIARFVFIVQITDDDIFQRNLCQYIPGM